MDGFSPASLRCKNLGRNFSFHGRNSYFRAGSFSFRDGCLAELSGCEKSLGLIKRDVETQTAQFVEQHVE